MKQAIFQIGKNTNTNTNTNKEDKQNNTYIENVKVIASIKPIKVAENVYYFNK